MSDRPFSLFFFFDDFARSLEVKFSSINQKLSQVVSTSSHDNVDQEIVSQDASNCSFSDTPDEGTALLQCSFGKVGCRRSTFGWFFPSKNEV